jgi:hypothetical protein
MRAAPQVINADMNLLRQHLGLAEPEDRFVTVLKVQKGAGSWKAKIKNDAVRARPGWSSALSVSHRKSVCMALLYGRARRLTAETGDFQPYERSSCRRLFGP